MKVVGLVVPAGLSMLASLSVLLLLPTAPESMVMQWSLSGEPSRIASPAELLVLPAIAMGVRLLLWVSTTMGKRRQVRVSLLIGNGVNAFVNSAVVVLLVGQLSSGAESTLPWLVLGISLVAAAVTVAISWFLLRDTNNK